MGVETGIIGASGSWGGRVLTSVLSDVPGLEVRGAVVRGSNPLSHTHITPFPDAAALIADPNIEAIIIASPASTHAEFIKQALINDLHVFVEKPFVTNLNDARHLVNIHRECWPPPVVLCDHVHLFNSKLEAIKASLRVSGGVKHLAITMAGNGPERDDCSPLWDYGSHAVALALWLNGDTRNEIDRVELLHLDRAANINLKRETVQLDLNLSGGTEASLLISNEMDKTYRVDAIAFNGREFHWSNLDPAPAIPPLTCALRRWLGTIENRVDSTEDLRFGLELPFEVCRTLALADAMLEADDVPRLHVQPSTLK